MADDFSELMSLVADLGEVPDAAVENVRKAIQVTSFKIKADWRRGATVANGYAKTYSDSITYETEVGREAVTSEIGPTLGKTPGASAGFLEDAPGDVLAPAQHAGRDALEANEEDFYRGLEIAITQAVVDKVEGG